jgi:hydroxymethylpyrimidine/phosphomethylpyrimidine kinase
MDDRRGSIRPIVSSAYGATPIACFVVQDHTEVTANQLRKQVDKLCKDMRWSRVKTKVMLNKWNVYEVVLFQRSSIISTK